MKTEIEHSIKRLFFVPSTGYQNYLDKSLSYFLVNFDETILFVLSVANDLKWFQENCLPLKFISKGADQSHGFKSK